MSDWYNAAPALFGLGVAALMDVHIRIMHARLIGDRAVRDGVTPAE